MIITKKEAENLINTGCPMSKDQKRVCELLMNGYNTSLSLSNRIGIPESDVLDILLLIDSEFLEPL
jgi:hypothetical protein